MALERLRLDGQVAIVTGAGRRVGRGIANVFAEAGASIVTMARTKSEIDRTVAEIEAAGGKAVAIVGDVTKREDHERLVAAAIDRFGQIDIVVNNAGGSDAKPFLDFTEEEFKYHVDWNTTSAFNLSQLATPHMIKRGQGSIVNISSGAGHIGLRGLAPYCAAKAGLDGLTRVMAQELAPKIRVNAIALGLITSPAEETVTAEKAAFREKSIKMIPLGRTGDPIDIGLAALYLCSKGCYATGAIFNIDGGIQEGCFPFETPRL